MKTLQITQSCSYIHFLFKIKFNVRERNYFLNKKHHLTFTDPIVCLIIL